MTEIRLVTPSDAEPLALHLARDRSVFAPWEPAEAESHYTAAGQAAHIAMLLERHAQGLTWPMAVLSGGVVIGQVNIGAIVRGAVRKGAIGYWIASAYGNRGHARRAVGLALDLMAGELGLHRAEASTVLEHAVSQRVLRANGFSPYGIAHEHTLIDGVWRDAVLFERTLGP